MDEKTLNLNRLLRLQTRAKWYRMIKEKRYRLASRDGEGGGTGDSNVAEGLAELSDKNTQLAEEIRKLETEFPRMRQSLRAVAAQVAHNFP